MNDDMNYQVLLLGPALDEFGAVAGSTDRATGVPRHQRAIFITEFKDRCRDLGLDPAEHVVITSDAGKIRDDGITAVVWFAGNGCGRHSGENVLQKFADRGVPIFPLVDTLTNYPSKVPAVLQPLNGKAWDRRDEVMTGILTSFGLLRGAKRVFISYLRRETTGIARQLFRELQLRGYQAVLDTARVAAGRNVQAELLSELSDVDVVLLLHSKEALGSQWVMDEIIDAQIRGTEIVDLLLPDARPQQNLDLATPYDIPTHALLNSGDPDAILLTDSFLQKLLADVERYRIRSVQTRRNRIIQQLKEDAETLGITIQNRLTGSERLRNIPHLQFTVTGTDVLAAFISQGIPDSREVHSGDRALSRASKTASTIEPEIAEARIIYDEYGVLKDNFDHLHWLNQYTGSSSGSTLTSGIETMRLCDAFSWLESLKRSTT